jgi:predicted Zn-dependent protease
MRLAAQTPLPWLGVHRALGVVEVSKGNLDGGWKEFSTELGLYPEDPAAWHGLGEHLKRTDQLKPAFELYSKLIVRRPGDRRARASITEVLLKNGDVASADIAFAPLVPAEDPYEMVVWANLLQAKGQKAMGDAMFAEAKAKMEAARHK